MKLVRQLGPTSPPPKKGPSVELENLPRQQHDEEELRLLHPQQT